VSTGNAVEAQAYECGVPIRVIGRDGKEKIIPCPGRVTRYIIPGVPHVERCSHGSVLPEAK